ncbi:MAG: PTS sugar transporter subunit IIB [Bacillota bacterium]|nr:PTS sugar transporter subunit IIB [Bacillota bacterium]
MICLVRIDGRLMHGMVAVSWMGAEKPDTFIVVNDKAANDAFETMTLKLAKPAGVDMFVWTKEKAVKCLNEPKYAGKKILLVVADVYDAEFVFNNVQGIKRLNVGPALDSKAGRITEGKQEFAGIYISPDEYEVLKRIHSMGAEIFAQMTPTVSRKNYADIEARFNAIKK